jgi:hypothetical protein
VCGRYYSLFDKQQAAEHFPDGQLGVNSMHPIHRR